MRPGKRKLLDKTQLRDDLSDQLDRIKASIRARAEHPFRVIKRQWGHVKVRAPEVNDRLMPGHWEGDLIKGAGNKSDVGVLVEPSTRLMLLCPMPAPRVRWRRSRRS